MMSGAIFDADGTLLDSMQIWEKAGERYLRTLGIKAESNLADILFAMSLNESSVYLKEQYGLRLSLEQIKSGILRIISDFYLNEVQLKTGVESFLHKLSQCGVSMVIATAGNRQLLESALIRLNIRNYFSRIFSCDEFFSEKTNPYIYIKAAEFMHTLPKHTVVFEDALHAICSASAAGFKTAAVEDSSSMLHRKEIQKNG